MSDPRTSPSNTTGDTGSLSAGPAGAQAPERASAGPYDVAVAVASSFGRLLPALAVLLLLLLILGALVYGIWTSVDRIVTIQGNLNKAVEERAIAQVAAAASNAEALVQLERARTTGLREAQEQIRDRNQTALDFSERLQKLISGQLDNMKKNEEVTQKQNERTVDFQKAQEHTYQARLGDLERQIKQTEQKREELRFAEYTDYKTRIAENFKTGRIPDAAILQLLEEKLADPELRNRALRDSNAESEPWGVRVALALALFHQTGLQRYLDQASQLTTKNASGADYAIATLYSYRIASRADRSRLNPLVVRVAEMALNPLFGADFRDTLLSRGPIYSASEGEIERLLGQARTHELAKYVSGRLRSAKPQAETACYPVPVLLTAIRNLSAEAELVYGTRLLDSGETSPLLRACVKSSMANGQAYERPTEPAFVKWSD